MKKSDLIVGNYYAYDRSRDNNPTSVTKVKLVSLDSEKGYRSKSNTVAVEVPSYRWVGGEREEYNRIDYVQLYTLKGDYDTVANAIELRKKDREIQSLKSQIEKNRRVGVMNQYKGNFIDFGISPWTFSEYRPDFTISFSEEQFKVVSKLLKAYNAEQAELKAAQDHAWEDKQLSHLIGSN